MAELSFVTPIVKTIFNGLAGFLKDETLTILNVKDELERMERKMRKIMPIIKNAEKKSFNDESIRLWLTDLKDIAYDIDDIIDDCKVEALALESTSSGDSHCTLCSTLCSHVKNFLFSREIGNRIKKINADLEKIAEENRQLHANAPNPIDQHQSNNAEGIISQTTCLVPSDLVGRAEEDAEKLIKHMLEENESGGRTRVNLAIVGMGGVGKTTLAQKIFDNVTQSGQFQPKMWICVSKEYKETDILKEIVRKAGGDYGNGETLDEFTDALVKAVRKKKFFLVLDDVWKEDIWNNVLKVPLKYGAKGSKVVITTREDNTAKQMSALYSHQVKPLSIEDGWCLLRNNVFTTENEMNSSEHFKDDGVKIIEKCDGLPLAIKAIAGILKTKDKQRGEWEEIISNEAWTQNIFENVGNVMTVLYLSYKDLPYRLKQCFVYCSLFPEDYIFREEELVPLWIAEGFLGDRETTKSGENLLKELVNRNLLQVHSSRHGLSRGLWLSRRHKLHDLLRSLGQRLGEGEYLCGNLKDLGKSSVRHLYLQGGNSLTDDHLQKLDKKLRTLILRDNSALDEIPVNAFQKLKYLRVLSLPFTNIDVIPDSIKYLLHLRYLDLRETMITIIPESISYLKSLQFLLVEGCKFLKKFPKSITSLQNLMLLDNTDDFDPIEMPKGLGRLEKLEKLIFKVGENENEAKLGEIRSLNLLRHLGIFNLQQNKSLEEARSVELVRKTHLQFLRLNWKYKENVSDEDNNRVTEVFEELRPPSSLIFLYVENFYGYNLPNWMSCSNDVYLNNLEYLEFQGCTHCQQLPGFGELPQLVYLQISKASSIKKIGREFLGREDRSTSTGVSICPFPKLQKMDLQEFSELEEWHWDGVEDGGTKTPFPCLKYLTIHGCPKLKSLPGFGELPQLEHLDISKASSIKKIRREFLGREDRSTSTGVSICPFPKLKTMQLQEFSELEEWHWDETEDGGTTTSFPCLNRLFIDGCPKLKSLPGFGGLPQLEYLNISKASSIKKIGCEFLGREDISTSTEVLICPFPKLKTMNLWGFSELEEWHWDGVEDGGTKTPFPCLKDLTIIYCPKLKSLPGLPTLKMLRITDFSLLQHVGNLNSLECVHFFWEHDGALPSWLSNALSNISSFRELCIITSDVQLLRRLCPWDIGLDWPLIKDVPCVSVAYVPLHYRDFAFKFSFFKDYREYYVYYTKSPFYMKARLPEYSGSIECSNPTEFSRMKGLIRSQASTSTS